MEQAHHFINLKSAFYQYLPQFHIWFIDNKKYPQQLFPTTSKTILLAYIMLIKI